MSSRARSCSPEGLPNLLQSIKLMCGCLSGCSPNQNPPPKPHHPWKPLFPPPVSARSSCCRRRRRVCGLVDGGPTPQALERVTGPTGASVGVLSVKKSCGVQEMNDFDGGDGWVGGCGGGRGYSPRKPSSVAMALFTQCHRCGP